ncbi:ATP-binding protein [Metabacillus fastidiosus]|uniref:ATP-binding protein n=1 Tax=Metabacillus fastidiosus TaxID=1458 RepID=UPI003D27ABB4
MNSHLEKFLQQLGWHQIEDLIENASTNNVSYFDFTFQPSISEQRVKETLTCRYIINGENRILLGSPGVSKTHLAISFAIEALT